jgi:DNA-binding beta-propeller fold protein YncE
VIPPNRVLAFLALALPLALGSGCGDSASNSEPALIFGKTGRGPGEFSYPRAVAAAPDGHFFVVDKAGRIQCFDADGAFIREWAMPEIYAGKPTGLGIDAANRRLYVADTHYSRVMIYDFDGTLLDRFGEHGDGPGQFRLLTDVAIDRDGFLYVGEYGGNDRISKFAPDHRWLFSFAGPDSGEARVGRPQGLLCDPDGTLWVVDAGNHRVCRFSSEGKLLGSFGKLGDGLGELRFPYGLDRLSDGTLVVCEYGQNRVQRFEPDGRSLGIWGGPGREPGQLAYPWSLAVLPEGRVLIVDSGNNRMQVINGLSSRTWREAK